MGMKWRQYPSSLSTTPSSRRWQDMVIANAVINTCLEERFSREGRMALRISPGSTGRRAL